MPKQQRLEKNIFEILVLLFQKNVELNKILQLTSLCFEARLPDRDPVLRFTKLLKKNL
jgi:hypothetical protein